MGTFLAVSGLLLAIPAAVAVLRGGWPYMFMPTRRHGALVLACAGILLAAGWLWPAPKAEERAGPAEQGESFTATFEGRAVQGKMVGGVGVALVRWEVRSDLGGMTPMGQFVLVQLLVENRSDAVQVFDPARARLLGRSPGQDWTMSTPGLVGLQVVGLRSFQMTQIQAGESAVGWVAFDVPRDVDPRSLTLEFWVRQASDVGRLPLAGP